jgi:hypothetical protein
MKRFLLIIGAFIIFFSGCAGVKFENSKTRFVNIRNEHIGYKKENVIHSGYVKEPYNDKLDKYIGSDDNGCSWAYFVNKETERIESWEYVSSPDKCETGLNWFGPW